MPRKPIFIIIPNGPNFSVNHSVRMKYWYSMFSSMGKVITIPINTKESDFIIEILADIRYSVNEKVRNSKNVFTNRPIILVGFHYGSIIAAHCALQLQKSICATICLGFPLKGVNGIRGVCEIVVLYFGKIYLFKIYLIIIFRIWMTHC